MRIFEPILLCIYSMRVANRLFDLGVDANRMGIDCGKILYEIERDRRQEFSPHEAAAYFFGGAFSNLPRECYLLPMSPQELAFRANIIMSIWVQKEKMRVAWANSIRKTLDSQT